MGPPDGTAPGCPTGAVAGRTTFYYWAANEPRDILPKELELISERISLSGKQDKFSLGYAMIRH